MEIINKIKLKLKEKGEVYLDIKARPGAAVSQIVGQLADETLKIDLRAKPEKGQANEELIRFLAKELAVSPSSIKLLAGKTTRTKLVKIIYG